MAEKRLYELLARINADRSVALHVRDLETSDSGRVFEGLPRALTAADAEAVEFLSAFNADAVAARLKAEDDLRSARLSAAEDLKAEKERAAAELLAAQQAAAKELQDEKQRAEADAAIAAGNLQELRGENSALTAQVATLTAQAETLNSQIESLTAELDALKNPPVDPRVLYPSEFQARLTRAERKAIFRAAGSEIEELSDIGLEAISTMWTVTRVELDNPLLIELLGALTLAGLIAPGRAEEIRA